MTEQFKKIIKDHLDKNHHLFYNTEGSKEAYLNCVKHISSVPSFNLGKLLDKKDIEPYDFIYFVDLDKETIIETSETIRIIPLKFY